MPPVSATDTEKEGESDPAVAATIAFQRTSELPSRPSLDGASVDEEVVITFNSSDDRDVPLFAGGSGSDSDESLVFSHTKIENDVEEIDFLNDPPERMTKGRQIARFMAANFKWYNPYLKYSPESWGFRIRQFMAASIPCYNPKIDEETAPEHIGKDPPSLDKAWAYFEHVTLERHRVFENSRPEENVDLKDQVVETFLKGDRKLARAEPGEKAFETELYDPLSTPISQLGDFGLGYGVYFSTVRSYAILAFFVGLLNLPIMLYYASDEYRGVQGDISGILSGSALCNDTTWVPCPDCPEDYQYAELGFSKWSHTTAKHVEFMEDGEWVNVTDYVNLAEADDTLRIENLYIEDVFTPETIQRFKNEFNAFISDSFESTEQIGDSPRPFFCTNTEQDCIIRDLCQCQIQSFQDCYCRFGSVFSQANLTVSNIGMAERNNCNGATTQNGFFSMATVILIILGTLAIRFRQNHLEVVFDHDEQTAQDYSICITNPPQDAYDPQEWKNFFETNFADCQVVFCTVDVENDDLVQQLVKRRKYLQDIENLSGMDFEHFRKKETEKGDGEGKDKQIIKLCRNLRLVEESVQEILKESKFPAKTVFVSFETENAQRTALKWLTVGRLAVSTQDKTNLRDSRHLFRGEHVLHVVEPEEPSSIRWQEIDSSRFQIVGGLLLTSFLCLVLICIAIIVIQLAYKAEPGSGPIVTTIFTSVFPLFAKALMGLEYHRNESSRQKWLFIKIATFYILTTSIALSALTPFTASLDPKIDDLPGLIPSVHALFLSQLGLTPFLQLIDIFGHLNRHVFAPRAKTQNQMNQYFVGSQIFLAERYANLFKYLFLMVWYGVLYPPGFFLGALALLIVYFSDRFSIMRTWSRSPQIGTTISDFARNYFTPTAVALMAVLSAYAWSGFPYDNLCETEDIELDARVFTKEWALRERGRESSLFGIRFFKAPDVNENLFIPDDSKVYKYCLQDFRAYFDQQSFPPLPKFQMDEWMTMEQEDLLNIYSWFAVGILAVVVGSFIVRNMLNLANTLAGVYSQRGEDQRISFSECLANDISMDTYIPSYNPDFGYPLILCEVDALDPKLFSWTDPERDFDYYDVTKDIDKIISSPEVSRTQFFARVMYWPEGGHQSSKDFDYEVSDPDLHSKDFGFEVSEPVFHC